MFDVNIGFIQMQTFALIETGAVGVIEAARQAKNRHLPVSWGEIRDVS
jgi:ethanolamine utilization microcompartment shell protein EutS